MPALRPVGRWKAGASRSASKCPAGSIVTLVLRIADPLHFVRLIFVDSLARLLPFTRSEAYGASKAAVYYLAKCLEVDLRDRGLIVQSVSPGFVRTPLTDKNDFAMPMRIEADDAAAAILRRVETGERTAYFPTLFSGLLRLLSNLPSSLQASLCWQLARRQEVQS